MRVQLGYPGFSYQSGSACVITRRRFLNDWSPARSREVSLSTVVVADWPIRMSFAVGGSHIPGGKSSGMIVSRCLYRSRFAHWSTWRSSVGITRVQRSYHLLSPSYLEGVSPGFGVVYLAHADSVLWQLFGHKAHRLFGTQVPNSVGY